MNIEIDMLGGNCPVQAEGTIEGHPFYFRARGSHWSLEISPPPGISGALWEYGRYYAPWPHAGWMTEDEALAFIRYGAEQWKRDRLLGQARTIVADPALLADSIPPDNDGVIAWRQSTIRPWQKHAQKLVAAIDAVHSRHAEITAELQKAGKIELDQVIEILKLAEILGVQGRPLIAHHPLFGAHKAETLASQPPGPPSLRNLRGAEPREALTMIQVTAILEDGLERAIDAREQLRRSRQAEGAPQQTARQLHALRQAIGLNPNT